MLGKGVAGKCSFTSVNAFLNGGNVVVGGVRIVVAMVVGRC